MNAAQRKILNELETRLSTLEHSGEFQALVDCKAKVDEAISNLFSCREEIAAMVETIREEVEEVSNEEQDKFDNMPEGLQQSDNGQLMEKVVSNLADVLDHLEGAIESLGDEELTWLDNELEETKQSLQEAAAGIAGCV